MAQLGVFSIDTHSRTVPESLVVVLQKIHRRPPNNWDQSKRHRCWHQRFRYPSYDVSPPHPALGVPVPLSQQRVGRELFTHCITNSLDDRSVFRRLKDGVHPLDEFDHVRLYEATGGDGRGADAHA